MLIIIPTTLGIAPWNGLRRSKGEWVLIIYVESVGYMSFLKTHTPLQHNELCKSTKPGLNHVERSNLQMEM